MRLVACGLSCQRAGREVFANINFAVAASETLVVTGPNGAGKSSLLRLLAGLLHATGGSLALEGGEADLGIWEQSHFLGHADPVKPALTVEENLSFWGQFMGGGRARSAVAALAAVGLADLADLPGGYLSAGQRRRLSLARLLVVRRPLWLLDEPTSALDAAGQVLLLGLLQEHLANGGIAVAATHQPLAIAGSRNLALGART